MVSQSLPFSTSFPPQLLLQATMSSDPQNDSSSIKVHTDPDPSPHPWQTRSARPPIDYSSPKGFLLSFGRRWKAIWTKRFFLSLLFGQILSLCITCTNVTTTELVNRNWALPTTQTFFLSVSSFFRSLSRLIRPLGTFPCLSFTHRTRCISVRSFAWTTDHFSLTSTLDGLKGWAKVVLRDGWKCTSGMFESLNPSSSH